MHLLRAPMTSRILQPTCDRLLALASRNGEVNPLRLYGCLEEIMLPNFVVLLCMITDYVHHDLVGRIRLKRLRISVEM